MVKKATRISLLMILFSITGCLPINTPNPSPELGKDTVIDSGKFTETAALTQFPETSIPTSAINTADWKEWTRSPEEIVAGDSGQTYHFLLTSRFSVVLDESDYPAANLTMECVPDIVLGRISNVEGAPPGYYVIRFEGSDIGQCIIRNGSFDVTIKIIEQK